MSFEERFASAGRALDALVGSLRRARAPRAYRPRARPLRERLAAWRALAAEQSSSLSASLADWRRGMDSAGARRFNAALILGAMFLTAAATWFIATAYAPALSGREAAALSRISSNRPGPSAPAPASGPWWNRATAR